jgi:hypothetical protein
VHSQACSDGCVHFAVDAEGNICMTHHRALTTGLHPTLFSEMAAAARTVGIKQRKQLEAALAAEAETDAPKVAFFA